MTELFKIKRLINIVEITKEYMFDTFDDYIYIIYCADTEATVSYAEGATYINSNGIFIINGSGRFNIIPVNDRKIYIFSVNGSGDGCKDITGVTDVFGMNKFLLDNIIAEYKKFESSGFDDEADSPLMINSLLMQLLLSIRRKKVGAVITSGSVKNGLSVIEEVTNYLHENISSDIKLSDVAKVTGISATGLKKLFKEKMGMGVIKYRNIMRIEKAKMILSEGEYNVTQVANMLGYDSVHYFSKQFKQLVGISPGGYVKNIMNNC